MTFKMGGDAVQEFEGYHSEWNLGSPGGYDYQRTTQEIAAVIWARLNGSHPTGVELAFDHPLLNPVAGFADMLVDVYRRREGSNGGCIAVVAEEETLADVTENINLAERLGRYEGITGILAALSGSYEMHVARSKDLIQWELSPLNPVLRASDEDRQIADSRLTEAERQRIATARNINNSDLDFCEFQGRLIINYSWGNQQGVEHLAEAAYEGTEEQFLRGWFPSD